MSGPAAAAMIVGAALLGVLVVTLAGLRAWRDWLDFRRQTLAGGGRGEPASSGARIELADLRERIRRLEAIAAGVDL